MTHEMKIIKICVGVPEKVVLFEKACLQTVPLHPISPCDGSYARPRFHRNEDYSEMQCRSCDAG